jgi:hypothetical protein
MMFARVTFLSMSLLCCLACSEEPKAPPAKYEVRGLVVEMSGEGEAARATIHHEDIAAFKDRQGQPTGMKSMKMAFGVGPNVDPSLLKPDSKLELVLEVDWERRPSIVIIKATPLPAETQLQLR